MSRPAVLKGMEVWALSFTAVAAIGSIYWRSSEVTLGVIAGGLLMAVNLYVIRRVVSEVIGEEGEVVGESRRKKRKSWMIFQYVLKMLAMLAFLWGALKWGGISPIGLLLGITAALTALLIAGLRAAAFGEEEEN